MVSNARSSYNQENIFCIGAFGHQVQPIVEAVKGSLILTRVESHLFNQKIALIASSIRSTRFESRKRDLTVRPFPLPDIFVTNIFLRIFV